MKQRLVLLSLGMVLTQVLWGQTTIVNYDFNAGTSYATLVPVLAPNVTCSMASSTITYSRTGTGQASINAFTANATAGTPLVSGTAASGYWQFSLGGAGLNVFKGYMVHVEHQISAAGTRTLQLSYSTNGTTWTNVGSAATTITAYVQQDWDLGSITALNGQAAVYFRLTVGGSGGTQTVRIDNFQILSCNNPSSPAGYYRSKISGDWSSASTWEYSADNGAWADATAAPDANALAVTVRNGHVVAITGTTIVVTQQVTVQDGGTIDLNRNGGYVPTATWDVGSTLLISGQTDVNPFYGDQNFGNITVNAPAMTGANAALGNNNNGTMQLKGTLTIANTGDTFFSQFQTPMTIGNFVQTGGIFQMVGGGTARTLNITGNFTLSSGTCDPARGSAGQIGTINLAGDFTQGGGTLSISATNASADVNFNFTGSTVQTFTRTAGTITCVSGPNLNFIITSGAIVNFGTSILNNSGGSATAVTFTLASGGTIRTAHTAGLATGAAGTIQVGGTRSFNAGASYGYNGSSAQVTGNALPGTVNTLTIANAAGVTLSQATTVSGVLALTSGILTTSSSAMLTLGSAATVAGGGDAAFVGGPMRNTWTAATSAKVFPIGKTTYEPIAMALTTPASPVIQAEVFNANAGGTFGAPLTALSTAHYYQTSLVSGTATNAANTVTLPNNNDLITTSSLLAVTKSTTQTGVYTSLPGANTGTNLVVTCAGYNPASGNFLVLGTTDVLLPVELTSFTARTGKRGIELAWSTATEINNAGFEVQRRAASGDWMKLGFVAGNGSSNIQHAYAYTDAGVASGTYAYRLKQIDRDGAFMYSGVVEATMAAMPEKFGLDQNYPNPFNPATTIRFSIPEGAQGRTTLRVYDLLGREVTCLVDDVVQAGVHEAVFDASHLASGVYIYRLQSGTFDSFRTLMLMK